ncbi:MAG: hypothetical protein ABFS24_03845 [Pseudomonadota bacterium]
MSFPRKRESSTVLVHKTGLLAALALRVAVRAFNALCAFVRLSASLRGLT